MTEKSPNSKSRTLRIATVAQVVLLVISGFFLFTEHRAHYLGALPYALAVAGITICLWLWLETRETMRGLGPPQGRRDHPREGSRRHEP